jgi:hypothetical protein
MKNISAQYQELKEGKMTQHQFLRNARMMFPNFVTNHNSFNDSVAILKTKGLLSEGDAVKGTPDKDPTYESPTPDDKIKYKKVEQSPEVDEQDGIYPATSVKDVPKKEKTYKKVKNTSDGLEPIKDNDTKNELKKVKVVKENLGHNEISSIHPEGRFWIVTYRTADGTKEKSFESEKEARKFYSTIEENIAPEEIDQAEIEITTNDSSIQAMADKLGVSQEELFKLLLKKLGGLKENKVNPLKEASDYGYESTMDAVDDMFEPGTPEHDQLTAAVEDAFHKGDIDYSEYSHSPSAPSQQVAVIAREIGLLEAKDEMYEGVGKSFEDVFKNFLDTDDSTEIKAYVKEKGPAVLRLIRSKLNSLHGQARKKVADYLKVELDEARFKKGTDLGKPGKGFEKVAKAAEKEYGSKEAGQKVAGAMLKKVLNKESAIKEKLRPAIQKLVQEVLDEMGQ